MNSLRRTEFHPPAEMLQRLQGGALLGRQAGQRLRGGIMDGGLAPLLQYDVVAVEHLQSPLGMSPPHGMPGMPGIPS